MRDPVDDLVLVGVVVGVGVGVEVGVAVEVGGAVEVEVGVEVGVGGAGGVGVGVVVAVGVVVGVGVGVMITVQRFPTESAWLAGRAETIGGSESPALFDVGFESREDFIRYRATDTRPNFDAASVRRMNMGKLLEPVAGALLSIESTTGLVPIPCGWSIYKNERYPGMHATPDFWLQEGIELAEIKGTGPNGLRAWGYYTGADAITPGSRPNVAGLGGILPKWWTWNNEPPLYVTIQAQHQMACTGAVATKVMCIAGTEWNTWRVPRDEDLIAMIAAEVARAWAEIREQRKSRRSA